LVEHFDHASSRKSDSGKLSIRAPGADGGLGHKRLLHLAALKPFLRFSAMVEVVDHVFAAGYGARYSMPRLHHHPIDANSRFVRLLLAESGIAFDLVEERPWARDDGLLALNPAATVPVYVTDEGLAIPGALGIGLGPRRLTAAEPEGRVEVRRLVAWYLDKFRAEVGDYLVGEKILKRFLTAAQGGGAPDMSMIRAAKQNIRHHLDYAGWLVARRNWLAGERMTMADLAAAAAFSVVDYLGDVPWSDNETAKDWYARIKSRPSFRPLLQDSVRGTAPASHYADLDF
jgi:glutathione S-transferase